MTVEEKDEWQEKTPNAAVERLKLICEQYIVINRFHY
jgi:hypothetical protein